MCFFFSEIYSTTCYCVTTELSLFNPMYLADLILWFFLLFFSNMSFDRIDNCRCSTQRAASTHIRARNSQSFFVCSLAAESIFLISSFDAAFAHSCSLSLLKNFFLFFFSSREDLKTASRCCCGVLRVYNVPACCLMICIREKRHAGKKSSRKKKMKNKLAELGKIF